MERIRMKRCKHTTILLLSYKTNIGISISPNMHCIISTHLRNHTHRERGMETLEEEEEENLAGEEVKL